MRNKIALFLLALPLAAQVTPPAPPAEPSQIVGLGAGIQGGIGSAKAQVQGGYFIAQHTGAGLYLIESTDFVRMPGGKVGTSARAGVLTVLRRFGPASFSIVGDAGVAEGQTGSAVGALSGWGIVNFRIASSPFSIAAAAQTTKIAGTGEVGQFRIYFTYSFN